LNNTVDGIDCIVVVAELEEGGEYLLRFVLENNGDKMFVMMQVW
jgi:hypothetical protein